jgi:Reverse transcriptase (RNA-dependent DNA polymerase)
MTCAAAPLWQQAESEEYAALQRYRAWRLVPRPPGAKVVGSRWVYVVGRDEKRNITKIKARGVATGYSQRYGVDYEETFASVSHQTTQRVMAAVMAACDLEERQLDVRNAFLQGELQDKIYMEQLPGWHQGPPDTVCELLRPVYGLKQSPRCWQEKVKVTNHGWEFVACDADSMLFVKQGADGPLYLLVFVDDCKLFGPTGSPTIDEAEKQLCSSLDMRRIAPDSEFVGISWRRDRAAGTVHLSQERYLNETLEQFNMSAAKPVSTPWQDGVQLQKAAPGDELCTNEPYGELVGRLQWLAHSTRPDIARVTTQLSRYVAAPRQSHWHAAKYVLRYLAGTRTHGLRFGGACSGSAAGGSEHALAIKGYCDASHADDIDSRRSHTGYVNLMAGAAVSWNAQLQQTPAVSTAEAELQAAGSATRESLYLRKLRHDLGAKAVPLQILAPRRADGSEDAYNMLCDNQACLALVKNPCFHGRAKHIDIIHHFVRDRVMRREVKFDYCPTDQMVADCLTKPLKKQVFERCRDAMGVVAF